MVDVKNFEGLYKITRDGMIWSNFKKNWIKQHEDKDGYFRVALSKKSKRYNRSVHRLVAEAFMPKEDDRLNIVNHLDCNKKNNIVENLEWTTVSGNTRHAWENGLMENARFLTSLRSRKLTHENIRDIKMQYATSTDSREEIALKFNVSISTIWKYTKETKNKLMQGKHKGRVSNNRKVSKEVILKIKEETMKKRSNRSIAIEFAVDEHLVAKIKNGTAYADYLK